MVTPICWTELQRKKFCYFFHFHKMSNYVCSKRITRIALLQCAICSAILNSQFRLLQYWGFIWIHQRSRKPSETDFHADRQIVSSWTEIKQFNSIFCNFIRLIESAILKLRILWSDSNSATSKTSGNKVSRRSKESAVLNRKC